MDQFAGQFVLTEIKPLAALIGGAEWLERDAVVAALAAEGWRVLTTAPGAAALKLLGQEMPALILVELRPERSGDAAIASVIRREAGRAASAPIVALAPAPVGDAGALLACDFDDVAELTTPVELAEVPRRWRPDDAGQVLDRLQLVFGEQDIRSMVDRFRDLLLQGLSVLNGDGTRRTAHKIAGVAGTLGFAEAGRAWLAVSEGDESAVAEARRQARRAVAAIDRRP